MPDNNGYYVIDDVLRGALDDPWAEPEADPEEPEALRQSLGARIRLALSSLLSACATAAFSNRKSGSE